MVHLVKGMVMVVVVKMTGFVIVVKVLKVTSGGSGKSGKSDGFGDCGQ